MRFSSHTSLAVLLVFSICGCGGGGGGGDAGRDASMPDAEVDVGTTDATLGDASASDASTSDAGFDASVDAESPDAGSVSGPGYLKASNTGVSDEFGRSVSLSADGTRLAVGAPQEDSSAAGVDGDQTDNSVVDGGAVYVFSWTGTMWAQEAYLKASNTEANDRFGASVSLSADGTRLAVGAWQEGSSATGVGGDAADNSADNSGAVYVFSRTGTTWALEAYVKASNTGAGDQFGVSVSVSADGSRLAVGANGEDSSATGVGGDEADNSASYSGAVYML